MVPGLPREPAACGRGRLLSSFRGAAVPPLAPARSRHAPRGRRPRAPPAPLAPCDSARLPCAPPPPPPVTARSHPLRPGCGRGDDQCAPASRAPATRQALCTQEQEATHHHEQHSVTHRLRQLGDPGPV